ncbi:hypothetical protein B0O99DRAFT_344705 [Bisporella sp. PMI_857]|nr:hypothetical protein B0O99DRAFT_344705 [Bisporella sp. PMI_857]
MRNDTKGIQVSSLTESNHLIDFTLYTYRSELNFKPSSPLQPDPVIPSKSVRPLSRSTLLRPAIPTSTKGKLSTNPPSPEHHKRKPTRL